MAAADGTKSDLPARTVSAVVMVAVAALALALGGLWWTAFVGAIGIGVFAEWSALAAALTRRPGARAAWVAAGLGYIGLASFALVDLRLDPRLFTDGYVPVLLVVLPVIATDVGAYFCGRAIGGPKIAPKISPSKTWAGLVGGMVASAAVLVVILHVAGDGGVAKPHTPLAVLAGALIAVAAQAGDFFESWMKRRAGVKDSGKLIPGHGGLFDRADGLLAVLFVIGVLMLRAKLTGV